MIKEVVKPGLLLATVGASLLWAPTAQAFCGFYVAGGDSSLFNNATQVVLMRDGTRTVLSMQNNYQGPTEDFAMVIPVPVVLQEENVKTLRPEIFTKVDQMTAPRLVEYWEKDPCEPDYRYDEAVAFDGGVPEAAMEDNGGGNVTVEAEFSVGEYEIVILSTDDATALDSWLTTNNYRIPEGASDHFNPYVTAGSYFFVAKVDSTKVTMDGDNLVLSPLRVHYDSTEFSLPIKLGLINADGEQDLIVYILGNQQRYEVANRENVFIPTNLEVVPSVKDNFGDFYRSLFAETVGQAPGAAVTEYSWNASTCDPCPGPTLDGNDFMTLGQDVTSFAEQMWGAPWVITRLHLRYTKDTLGEDLVFQEAGPIVGGREIYDENKELETGAKSGTLNNFQGRYIIRYPWSGAVACLDPIYQRWGGPTDGSLNTPLSAMSPNSTGESAESLLDSTGANGDAAGGSTSLPELLVDDVPELGLEAGGDRSVAAGCSCDAGTATLGWHALLLFILFWRQKRPQL